MAPEEKTRDLAWNGLSLTAPAHWEPAVVDNCYLRLDADHGPAMELKWERGLTMYSMERRIKILKKRFSQAQFTTSAAARPQPWNPAVKTLEQRGFVVRGFAARPLDGGPQSEECGLLAYSAKAELALLLRFPPSGLSAQTQADVLSSLRAHPPEHVTPWSVFDFRAKIPGDLPLNHATFRPGHFRLCFGLPGRPPGAELIMDRLAPADVITRDKGLEQWASNFYSKQGITNETKDREREYKGWPSASWSRLAGRGRFAAWVGAVMGAPGDVLVRAWTPAGSNRILAVIMRSPLPGDLQLFEQLCRDYEAL